MPTSFSFFFFFHLLPQVSYVLPAATLLDQFHRLIESSIAEFGLFYPTLVSNG